MWAGAQRDGRPAEYKLRHLRKFRNSIPCTTPQSLLTPAAGVPCSNENAKLERKVDTAKYRAKFVWPLVKDVAAVTKARSETR